MDAHHELDVSSPKQTRDMIQRYGISAKKSLGQNFLIDANILHKIVQAAELDPASGALEVGPGIGALTQYLARTAQTVVAIELDQRLLPVLSESLSAYNNVHIVHGDVLELDLQSLWSKYFAAEQKVSVVANLPYYITTPIVMKLLENRLPFLDNIVVMVQKEVADRLTALPGSKQYGSLSVAIRYYCEPDIVTYVPRTVFIPQPNVESAVIKLKMRHRPPVQVGDENRFLAVVRSCFAQRRKTIANNLLQSAFFRNESMARERLETILRQAQIEPTRRAETVSIEEFAALFNVLETTT